MKFRIERSVTVITPTIGKPHLTQAMKSVAEQDYPCSHLIVIDGPEFFQDVMKTAAIDLNKSDVKITCTPFNTGRGGFYGHRIYAAYPHLVDSEYILFLDEDNWWSSDHVSTLIDTIEDNNYDWAYSLRKVYKENDEFLDDDCCESIGRWPVFFSAKTGSPVHLVDTSSYCFRREFLIQVSQHWHHGWGGDRRFFMILKNLLKHDNYGTTGKHTLHYRLPDMNKAYGGDYDFFRRGNQEVKNLYGGEYPWIKAKT